MDRILDEVDMKVFSEVEPNFILREVFLVRTILVAEAKEIKHSFWIQQSVYESHVLGFLLL